RAPSRPKGRLRQPREPWFPMASAGEWLSFHSSNIIRPRARGWARWRSSAVAQLAQGERNVRGGLSRFGMASGGAQYLVRGSEEDADTKDYQRADHGPPGERDFGNPDGLLESPVDAEHGCRDVEDRDVQLADDNRCEEPGRDGEHVSDLGTAPLREHADEEDTEHGAQNESGDSKHDRNDSHIRIGYFGIGESAGDDDHEHGEEDREPACGPDVVRLALAANPADVPIVRGTGRQGVERRGEGAHGGGEDA